MRIAVCCKAVPAEAVLASVQVTAGDIQVRDMDLYLNEVDNYALEAALGLKASLAAEIVALTLGPLRAQDVLYVALAKGVDRALRIDARSTRPELIAAGLSPPLRELACDLVFVGVQGEDWMGAEVAAYLAEGLGMSLAYAVMEISEITATHVRLKKEIGGGKRVEVRLRLPAVLAIQSGIAPLRYLSMIKLKKARNEPVKLWGRADPEQGRSLRPGMSNYAIERVALPEKESHATMIEGDRGAKASRVLEIITKAV